MAKANDRQVGGDHYKKQKIQHWDYVVANDIPYLEAQVMKYVGRWRAKDGMKDLEKAKHVLEKIIENARLEAEPNAEPVAVPPLGRQQVQKKYVQLVARVGALFAMGWLYDTFGVSHIDNLKPDSFKLFILEADKLLTAKELPEVWSGKPIDIDDTDDMVARRIWMDAETRVQAVRINPNEDDGAPA